MTLPDEILLPSNARYYTLIEQIKSYNANYDIVWSFKFRVPLSSIASANYQYGFTTFLTTISALTGTLPGHYLGDYQYPNNLLIESGLPVVTADDRYVMVASSDLLGKNLINIGFDTTGLYGLTGLSGRGGVNYEDIIQNSIIVRNYDEELIYYTSLSNLTQTIPLTSDDFITLRFRYTDLGSKLYIDVNNYNTEYNNLTCINTGYKIKNYENLDNIKVGVSFCTPISTTDSSSTISEFHLKDFHIEGVVNNSVSTETIATSTTSYNLLTSFTTVSNITAI